ncbi:dynein heavy chain domain-containing protein 1 [Phodopus roborovskii]|uniref:Dynein heavy chain domain-containing protein 1 n=1 Tax=Phodopus roborovskii TaxID=109678 RepID=A0AAU9ZNJ3_PHORO|nr:dynein heavy chain domain-containing protein 1 [Phodopus roborovskii]CAH6792870.1 Dnhd1 [Phodopus roborovskii]
MKPHPQTCPSSLPMTSTSRRLGETQQPKAWNWHLNPELWARSVRQQLNTCLRFIMEETKPSFNTIESGLTGCSCSSQGHSWDCVKKQELLRAVVESEQRTSLELLLSELRSLLSAVLQDGSREAWRYLYAVLGLLPPYREMLAGQLDLLPLLEQLYCWAPTVQSQLQLDLLDAIDKAFPPDRSLLHSSSHVDCHHLMKRSHRASPWPTCPFVKALWSGQQKRELATWLRPLTLPELQHCLGIVGAEVALEETQWMDSLSLLPLALATEIPVQYESSNADYQEGKPAGRKSQLASESHEEKGVKKKSSKTSLLRSQVKSLLKIDWYQKKIHFLYLNVAPDRYFKPYNLIVVPPNKVNPEHYIFSPFGILHVHPVEGSETMTLGTWHRNSAVWHELQNIPFFKNCLLRKALTCWKKNVRLYGLHRIHTFLKSHLLLAVPHFGAGMLHISRLLQEFRSVSWLPKELDKCYELLDLQKTIAKENHKALRVFCRFLNLCTSILQLVHEDTYQMQQGLQERVQNWNRIRKGQGSIYLQRVLCRHLEKKLKQAETWLMKMGKFARLIDYMICQNLVSILEEEITSFVANTLQAPRQNPFLLSQLVFDDNGKLSPMPCVETIIQSLTKGLQSIKTSALKVVQSTELRTSRDSPYSEDDKDQDVNAEFQMPKFHGKPSDAVRLFCGPNVGFVWPWKSHAITDVLEVRGHRLRGQYLHPNYNHLQEDLDNNAGIQQALAIQQALLEDMLQEVREFCNKQQWVETIYEFLKAWGPQKLEDLRGSPIKDYVVLVNQLEEWQERVSNMPVQLLTKGKLLLLSGHDVQAELESKLNSMRKNILAQVQSECWSRNQRLMTELTDFLRVFQTINSDIHAIAQCSQKLNEANEQYSQLEERVEYVRSLHDLIRNHCGLFIAENETLDISLLDLWEAFQFERSQASEFLLSKQHSIVPKLQQLMAAALAELEGLLAKALSGPFMDPSQEQRSTEHQLTALEHQFLNILKNFNDLRYAYNTFTGNECPMSPPVSGSRPIVLQQRIWRLYRIISENFSEWKCMAFTKFSLSMAREKTDAWLTEAARLSTTLGLHSPVLQRCMRMLEEFRSYLPLLTKLGGLQLQNFNSQSLLRVLGLGGLQSFDLLPLGQLLNCPLLEFSDRINQVWQHDKERIHAQDSLQQMQQYWEGRQLRLLNFILHVPYKPPASERSKRQAFRSPRWESVGKDSGTFLLSDYSSLQDAIQNSLQALFKILAIQKSGELHKTALEWVTIMYGLGALLEVWVAFQQKWIFLNKVLHEMKIPFPGAELNARFKVMDDQYRTLMRISVADPMVLSLIVPNAKRSPYFQGQHLQQLLKAGSVELEAIIMALEDVLYGVCAHFPRLFFLSDSELVALLAAPLETCEAQPWAQRCFPHIKAVNFRSYPNDEKSKNGQESSSSIQIPVETIAVLGAFGEKVELQSPLSLHPDLPKWLASLEKCLRFVIVNLLQSCVATRLTKGPSLVKALKALPQQRQVPMQLYVQHWLDAVQVFPWQCILVAEEVVWRAEMEEVLFERGTMSTFSIHVHKLEVLVQFLRDQRHSQGEQPLPSVRQTSLFSALLVMTVTHRDVAQLLEKHLVSDLKDFHWVRQLKYHLGSSHLNCKSPLQCLKTIASTEPSLSPAACWVDVLGRSFIYNYEYLGPKLGPLPSLVHERQVLVLLLALEEVACGTLLGRDGLGKTEMVNSLSWTLGRQLVMMPCLPQIEFRCLSNYLNGALQSGAWLLLENVHQLPPSLLSALGQRLDELHHLYAPLYQKASKNISTINPAKAPFLGAGFFEKHRVSMRFGYGCFLTFPALSPDVPANLHLLLRPVAFALPDLQRVAELNLLSAGVRDASRLAIRLSKLFSLERELVSGTLPCRLSLLKQVLEDTKQTLNATEEGDNSQQPHNLAAPEEVALLHALLHSPLFSILDGLRLQKLRELLCGIFPNASHVLAEPVTHRLMRSVVVEELQQLGLLPTPHTLTSLEQLSQALSRASGVLLLGPAGSGKSTCWKSLLKIQNRLAAMEQTSTRGFQSVEIAHLYPSVLSTQEFLGWSEGPSWHYGIFPKLLHAAPPCKSVGSEEQLEEFTGIQQWIVCDGAPNSTWIDSITCLLSDPPQLSLPNGQQIARPLSTFFLMEVAEASGMSPTVVGRCALVWCCGEQTWQCMLNVLMASLPHEYHLQQETIIELNHLAEVLVPSVQRFLTRIGASSLLQVHGHQTVCPGVAEVTSLTRILRALFDPHLRLYEEEKPRVQEDFSGSDLATQSFKSSKSKAQSDSDSVNKKQRRHLLAISSFLFATIWGFGAHLPSRYWPLFDNFMRNSISSLSNYPEPPPSALVFDLHVHLEDGTLVPFAGHYLSSCVKGSLSTFQPTSQTERLLYVVDLLLSNGQPVLLAGEIATGKSAFVEVLVEPNHPSIHSPIHPALSSTHLRHLLGRGVHGQTQVGSYLGYHQDSKGSLLFLMEDLHLAASDPEKSCQPVLETLRQAMEGTIYARNSLELQTLQPTVNFLATATVPGYSERPLCPRLFRLFTVLALDNMTQDTLLSRHVPSIQAWLERFPSVERENTLARALVRASVKAWKAVCNCFMPSPLRPHYRFSLHSVSHILGSLQLLPSRTGSRGSVDTFHHQEHLRRVSGLRGTRLTIMMSMRIMARLWLHEAQRTFCDRLDSDRERSHCANLLLEVAQNVFCCDPESHPLVKDYEEEVEEEKVPEVESEGEIAQWEDLSNSDSESEEEEDPYGIQTNTVSFLSDSGLAPFPIKSVNKENRESVNQMAEQEEDIRASGDKLQSEIPKNEWQMASQMDLTLPLLLPVLLLYPQEKPSDLVFSLELTLGSNTENPNMYLERQWGNLEKQLAASAVRLKLNPNLIRCHMMTQHVARLVRVLARPRQHGLLLSMTRGTGRHTAISLASSICQAHLFHLPSESEEATFQCLRDASWCAGVLNQPVALLVPDNVNIAIFQRLVALATSGSFPDQYTEADLDNIEEHLPKDNPVIKLIMKKDTILHRFYQQVCSNLHMLFLMGDDQIQKQLPSTLLLRLLQLATASVDRYEPWDQASLVRIAQYHLENVQSLPLDDGSLKCPDIKALIPNVAKIMALIHLSSAYYHQHLCPALPLVTPKTFLDFLDMFLQQQQQMILKMRMRAWRIHSALKTLRLLVERHSTQTNLLTDLEQQLKGSYKNVGMYQSQLEQSKLLYKQKMAECQHQESLIENLVRQQDALQTQQEAFLEQMGKAFLGPLSQLQVADFEEIRSYRAPPDAVVQVTDALCDLFHHETGWASAKQLLCTEDFYQELVFFPKEKLTDSELIKLNQALKAPGMSDTALRSVSIPAASLAVWLRAVLRYGLAQRRGLPTGLLLRQVEATLAREQARLGQFQFQAHDLLEQILSLTKKLEEAQASHNLVMESLNQAQCGQYHKWPMKTALLTPMHMWTIQLQKLKDHCKTVFGDALLCSAAIVYLGPFPPRRRQELLEKWLSLCQGFEEPLAPDDVAQALKQKSVGVPPKNPLVPTCSPFRILTLLSCGSEQQQWDRDLKPQAKSARLLGLMLRSHIHFSSCRWPLLLDPSNQALIWLNPLPLKQDKLLEPPSKENRAKCGVTNQDSEDETEDEGDNDNDEEDRNEANNQTKEQKIDENKSEEMKEQEEKETEKEKNESESSSSSTSSETLSPPLCLTVLSGADLELGPQLLEAAANGLPVLLTNMELSLGCQELRRLLSRENLSPPHVQPGFCLYLSTALPIHALERVLGSELLKGLNILDLGLNMEILEEQMLHEILCRERPELETRWQDLKIRAVDTSEAVAAAEERLLVILLLQNQKRQKPSKFLRAMVRTQAKICQLNAQKEEIEEQKLEEMVLWAPYRQIACHGMAIVEALSPLQNLLPFFCMNLENWLATTRRALDSIKPHDSYHGEDLTSHLLQLKIHLTRQLLTSTVAALGLTQAPLVGALGALALLQVAKKTPKIESLALWPGLSASPSTGHNTQVPGVVRPAWLGLKAWQECGVLELLSPFAGLRASLAGHSSVWQDYLSLSSTVLGPAPGPNSAPLSLLQKLILWRVLRPDCLAGALADLTTSLLGRPLDEDLGAPTMIFEHNQATQPILILLPPPGHPTSTLHPVTVIRKLAANHEKTQKHLHVIALGSEDWDPVSTIVNTLCQAMLQGHWLVLDNCHLMPHWPRELLQPLLGLLDGARVVSDSELSPEPESRNVATVHRDFRLWLIVSTEASASLPGVLTQHSKPVFWDQSLELGRILIDSVSSQQGLCMQPLTQTLPLFLLHGLLLHRQLYGIKLQAHRGRWSQVTLTKILQIQEHLWASLSNPRAALLELAASVFYGGSLGDPEDREALISLTRACLNPRNMSWAQPHTPQYLLATLMPSPELGELDAMTECKAQMQLLPTPAEPRTCGLNEGPKSWLLRRQSRAFLNVLQQCSPTWVPSASGGNAQRKERRLRQRLVQAKKRLVALQALLTNRSRSGQYVTPWAVLGPNAHRPLEGFLETEVLELRQLVGILQRDLDCLLQQLKGETPCNSSRCAEVAHALWAGRLPRPWRSHAAAGPQLPWQWLRQLSRRGHLLIRYLDSGTSENAKEPERIFHLSAFRHPRRLLLALRWEAILGSSVPSPNLTGNQGSGSSSVPPKRQELNNHPLHIRVENGPNPKVPEMGLLLIGLQLQHAEWDQMDGALQDSFSSQPSPLPPVSISTQTRSARDAPVPAGLDVYSCPVYMTGPLGTTKLHSKNILMHLPLPTKLSPDTCIQRRVHVCSTILS